MVELVFKEQLQKDQALHLPAVSVSEKSCLVFKNVSKSLKKLRHDVWHDGENKLLNMEFI